MIVYTINLPENDAAFMASIRQRNRPLSTRRIRVIRGFFRRSMIDAPLWLRPKAALWPSRASVRVIAFAKLSNKVR